MITSVDTNVLLDVFLSNAPHHSQSREWLRDAYDDGAVILCDIVYAELVPAFGDRASLDRALREINATLSSIDASIAYDAGGCAGCVTDVQADDGNGLSPTF